MTTTMRLTPPKYAPIWNVTIRHPLAGMPLSEQMADADADAHVLALYPEWLLRGPVVQGRDRRGVRVLVCQLVRRGATDHDIWNQGCPDVRATVTLAR